MHHIGFTPRVQRLESSSLRRCCHDAKTHRESVLAKTKYLTTADFLVYTHAHSFRVVNLELVSVGIKKISLPAPENAVLPIFDMKYFHSVALEKFHRRFEVFGSYF